MSNFPKRMVVATLPAVMALLVNTSSGAFINGVEQFDGTTLDATTWTPSIPASSTITQNNELIITGPARYTTNGIAIKVGDTVSADVKILVNSTGASTEAHFTLVNPGVDEWSFAYSGGRSAFYLFHFTPPGGGGSGWFSYSHNTSAFTLQMQRLSSTSLQIAAISGGAQLFSNTINTGAMANDLSISLALRGSGQISFDNIRIIPEPSTAALIAMGVLTLCATRRRHTGGP